MSAKLISKIWPFILLTAVIVISQVIILKPHLKYGFSDVDWGFLSFYKTQNPYSIKQLADNFKAGETQGGVYTHQIYYIGIQNDLFDFNFKLFQETTHMFKILAILAAIPVLFAISGNIFITFLGTMLFAFSYSAVGAMYTVVTSSDYSAIFVMGIFIFVYYYVVKNHVKNWLTLTSLFLLLTLTLFLSTERMYPLPLFIALTEVFLIFKNKKIGKNTIRRIAVIFLPLLLIFLAVPTVFLSFVLNHGAEIVREITAGNWNLFLTPFIVQGSIIVPHDYTKYFGIAKMDSFFSFLNFLLSGPYIVFTIFTAVVGLLIFKKPFKFILETMFLISIFSIILYIAGSHFVTHLISIESITQALVGFYILALALVSFKYWLKEKDRLLIGLFAGPLLALLYIFLTWVGASPAEIFSGIHRYLTLPALMMSLFLGNLFALIILRILNVSNKYKNLKVLTVIPVILLFIYLNINALEIQDFFNGQLRNGFGAEDKLLMRGQLLSHLNNLNTDQPSLIYFDFTEDSQNGYYYDNTLLGGLGSWILWFPRINFKKELMPFVFWNNPEGLMSSVSESDGRRVFFYRGKIFELKDFYAFKLKDKKVINIKDEILNSLGI